MPAAQAQFIREQHLVTLLMQRLALAATYHDPNAQAGYETGADVLAVANGQRIGVQVTELDTGDAPGVARAAEKKDARRGAQHAGGVYGGWAQNDPAKVVHALQQAVVRKVTIAQCHDFGAFDAVWLLVSCGVPELGAVVSTFIMTPWLHADMLNRATGAVLAGSKYAHAFVHPVLGPEKALYHWSAPDGWQKHVEPVDPRTQGPSVWDILAAAKRR